MTTAIPGTIFLKDYRAPNFAITQTDLNFELYEDFVRVTAQLTIKRNPNTDPHAPLALHGQELELLALQMNGAQLDAAAYQVTAEGLSISTVPDQFTLTCITRIFPQQNTSLEGLYKSRTMFCTQCEAEGFRKITYYLDRPDAMSIFTTRIEADKSLYPVLLSNGNLLAQGEGENGRHWAQWQDPFKKPAYLFALVAGNLAVLDDTFTTMSGRGVALKIFVEPKDLDKCDHAMLSLKNSMRWDEEVYGREYDLDIFMIVAVDDFNMGAMENKGLNIFNTSCVLAHPLTTTDAGFARVEGVVAHEYFHNWSGNRVTCRDWFQLSLKEGFTVFRDEEFSADMLSRTVKRVESVAMLRTAQFAEDAGPMAHPVRPASYIEISNFYTLTVYEKGAEVVRMLHTLLGKKLFRAATDLYFERHDGEAATIEHFIQAMVDASGRDLSQFMHWYSQAGTPQVELSGHYNAEAQTFSLQVTQINPDTPEAKGRDKQPLHIPMAMGLLGEAGQLPIYVSGAEPDYDTDDNTHRVLEITQPQHIFVFERVAEPPVPSLFRNFSAPVKWSYPYSRADLLRIMLTDGDGFNRWDASQQLALQLLSDVKIALSNQQEFVLPTDCVAVYQQLLADECLDPAMVALMLELPTEAYLGEQQPIIEVDANHTSRETLRRLLAQELKPQWLAAYTRNQDVGTFSAAATAVAKRSLKNTALAYLALLDDAAGAELVGQQFAAQRNMTDQLSAFKLLVNAQQPTLSAQAPAAIASFYDQWQNEPLVVNLWLQIQATATHANALEQVASLLQSSAYDGKNPNKIRSLIGAFANQNLVNFHRQDGAGYAFLAEQILLLNQQNPQIAARLLAPLTKWRRYDAQRQGLMKAQLQRIAAEPALSKDVYEVVTKSLI